MDESDTGTDDTVRARDVRRAVAATLRRVGRLCVDWVDRRSRLSQLVVGAVIAFVLEGAVPVVQQLGVVWVSAVATASAADGVVALVCVQIGQTVVQAHKLDRLGRELERVNDEATTDGGREPDTATDGARRSWRSGGGIVGGGLAGATLGTAYGSQGVFVGAVVGAVLGDTLEEWTVTS